MHYSTDLRVRVVEAYKSGEGSFRVLGRRYRVNFKTVKEWVDLEKNTGSLVHPPGKKPGRPPVLTPIVLVELQRLALEAPDATEEELAERLAQDTGVKVHRSAIGRRLTQMGLTRKKRHSMLPSSAPTASST